MKGWLLIIVLVAASLLSSALALRPIVHPQESEPPVTLRTHLEQSLAPGHVIYRVGIPQHRDNIWFCVGWDNITTERSRTSCQQLNGVYSPIVFHLEYRSLAEGCYRGFVDVYRTPSYRAAFATSQFRIGYTPCA